MDDNDVLREHFRGNKNAFLNAQQVTHVGRKTTSVLFNNLSKYEAAAGKDICEFDVDDYIDAVSKAVGTGGHYTKTYYEFMQKYIEWCIEHNINGCNKELAEVVMDENTAMIRWYLVKDPAHLSRAIDNYKKAIGSDPFHPGSDAIYEVYFWLCYMGIPMDKMELIREGDVMLSRDYLVFDGMRYPIYPEAKPAFQRCLSITEFRREVRPAADGTKHYVYDKRADGDQLLRTKRPAKIKALRANAIKNYPASGDGATERVLRYLYLRKSGLFYETLNVERTTHMPPTFMDYAEQEYKSGVATLPKSGKRSLQTAVLMQAKQLLAEYKTWKKVYYSEN